MFVRDPTSGVELDRLERLLWILSALGLALALLGVVGESRGWWNDLGELFVSLGTVASVAAAVVAPVVDATTDQVTRVAEGVEANGGKLDRVADRSQANGDKLDAVNDHLGAQREVLVQIRDRL